jgi:hypothetical protein
MNPVGASEDGSRRSRNPCKVCGQPVELPRLREHLRREHRVDTTTLESLYLEARIDARRSQRARSA